MEFFPANESIDATHRRLKSASVTTVDLCSAMLIARRLFDRAADAQLNPGEITEFAEGWLIVQQHDPLIIGSGSWVLEKMSGRIMLFGSGVPPDRIVEDYSRVLPRGQEVHL